MNGPSSDRNLLLGIVALQMDFITRDQLIAAMHDWTIDKARSLSEILVKNGALDPADQSVLETLVERHIARHGGNVEDSLSSLELMVPGRSTLELMDDPDILQSLSKIGLTHTRPEQGTDAERTGSWRDTGKDTGGRFRIIRLHDEGGLGSVFLARDGEVNRDVALKQMKEAIAVDPQSRARFVLEAEVTGNLEHPGIVPVYGKGEYADGRPYYAMRFIRGDNLRVAVNRFHNDPGLRADAGARQREFQKLLRRFLAVCETMAYAHSRGIIHRDLKPGNILLGPYGETLVVDWGMAKVVGHPEELKPSEATLRPPSSGDVQPTDPGSRLGTPGYMSPEQARGEIDRLGPPADIYSLGATLYYMLTAKSAFTDKEPHLVLPKIERGDFPFPREVKPGVDRALEATCLKAMQLRPEDRYASCLALADDLEQWLADQPVSAYPEPLSAKALRWVRRHKHWVGAAAVLAVISIIGLTAHDFQLSQEQARTKAALAKIAEEQGLTKHALEVAGQEQLRTKDALERAAEQLGMTRDALRGLLQVASESLANFANSEGLRGQVAEQVLSSYRTLGEKFPADPKIRLETAQVQRVIGGIELMTGQYTKARESINQALDILTKLCNDEPLEASYRRWLIEAHLARGELAQVLGKTGESEREVQLVITLSDQFWSKPFTKTCRRVKGSALINLSEISLLKNNMTAAVTAAEGAIELLTPLFDPDQLSEVVPRHYCWLLSLALTDRAIALGEMDELFKATDDIKKARQLCDRVLKQVPDDDEALYQSALIDRARAELILKARTDFIGAERIFTQVAVTLRGLIEAKKLRPQFRELLAETLSSRAEARLALGPLRFAEAQDDCEASQSILEYLIRQGKQNGIGDMPNLLSLLCEVKERLSRVRLARGDKDGSRTSLAEAIENATLCVYGAPVRARDHSRLEHMKKTLQNFR